MTSRYNFVTLGVACISLIIASAFGLTPFSKAMANELNPEEQFEVVGELYAIWVATDLNTRKPDIIAVVPLRLRGPEILLVHPIPRGARIKILRKAGSRFPSFLYPDRYLVTSPSIDNAVGLPVVLDLAQGNEGTSTPLNPKIFRPLRE